MKSLIDDSVIQGVPRVTASPGPFEQIARGLLDFRPNVQRRAVYAILDDAHIVHGGSRTLIQTACAIVRCAFKLHQDGDPLAIDRVWAWCFEWIRERSLR